MASLNDKYNRRSKGYRPADYYYDADGNPQTDYIENGRTTLTVGSDWKPATLRFNDADGNEYRVPEWEREQFERNNAEEKRQVRQQIKMVKREGNGPAARIRHEWVSGYDMDRLGGLQREGYVSENNLAPSAWDKDVLKQVPGEFGKAQTWKDMPENVGRGIAGTTMAAAGGITKKLADIGLSMGAFVSDVFQATDTAASLRETKRDVDKIADEWNNFTADVVLGDNFNREMAKATLDAESELTGLAGLGLATKTFAAPLQAAGMSGTAAGTASIATIMGAEAVENTVAQAEDLAKHGIAPDANAGYWASMINGLVSVVTAPLYGRLTGVMGVKNADRVVKQTFGRLVTEAGVEALEGAGLGMVQDAAAQGADMLTGAQTEFSADRLFTSAFSGGLLVLGTKLPKILLPKLKAFVAENRRNYAAAVDLQAKQAGEMFRRGMPIVKTKTAMQDVKAVTVNGDVVFNDGTVYKPAVPDRTVDVNGSQVVVPGREARIVLADKTVLNAKGEVVDVLAGRMGTVADENGLHQDYGAAVTPAQRFVDLTDPEAAARPRIVGPDGQVTDIAEVMSAGAAPQSVKDWMAAQQGRLKEGAGEMPVLDAEGNAYMTIVANMASPDIEVARAAQLALEQAYEGRMSYSEAADALDASIESMGGRRIYGTRAEGETREQATVPVRETGNVEPRQQEERSGGAAPVDTIKSAEAVIQYVQDGTLAKQKCDISGIDATDPSSRRGPVIFRQGPDGKLTVVSGGAEIEAAQARGEKTVDGVVISGENGWNAGTDRVIQWKLTVADKDAPLTDLIKAVNGLGMTEAEAREVGISALTAWRMASRMTPETAGRVTPENAGRLDAVARGTSMQAFGFGWQDLQNRIVAAMPEGASLLQARIAGRLAAENPEMDANRVWEIAQFLDARGQELRSRGLKPEKMSVAEIEKLMAEDAAGHVPVEQPDGSLKTVEEIEAAAGSETAAEPETIGPDKSFTLVPAPNADGSFVCARFPQLRIRQGQSTDGGKLLVVDGLSVPEMLDPRNRRDMGEFLQLVLDEAKRITDTTGEACGVDLVNADAAYVGRELLRNYRESGREEAMTRRAETAIKMLSKSGLADSVVTDPQEFDAVLRRTPNGEVLAKEGVVWGYYVDGKVYLNKSAFGTKIGLNTVVHEFAHPAVMACEKVNPALYRRGMDLITKSEYYKQVKASKDYAGMSEERIRQEALVRLIADRFENIDSKVEVGIVHEIKQFVRDFWRSFGERIGIRDLTLEQVDGMTIDDIGKAIGAEMFSERRFGEPVKDADRPYKISVSPAPVERREVGDAKPVSVESAASGSETTVDVGGVQYSARSLKFDLEHSTMLNDLVEHKVFVPGGTEKQNREAVKNFEKNLRQILDRVLQNAFILDINEKFGKEDRPFNPFKPNSDPLYKISLDFSTLCKKRLLTQYVIENLQTKLDRVMSAEEQMAIRQMLLDYKKQDNALQVACHLCYVEAARLKAPKQINKFFENTEFRMRNYFAKKNPEFAASIKERQAKLKVKLGYKEDTPKKDMTSSAQKKFNDQSSIWRQSYKMSPEETAITRKAMKLDKSNFLTADGLAKLLKSDPDIYRAYTDHVRESTHSKGLETDVPYYYGDAKAVDRLIEPMNEQGTGLRHQSWSDFQMRHLLDTIVAVADLANRGAKMHAYTKVEQFAECFGKTGVMINLSLIPEATGEGFSPTEGMPIETAVRLREKYPETCGTIAIGKNYEHVLELVNDPRIDYVIPYHVSGLNKTLRRMVGIEGWKDFTSIQHERSVKTGKSAEGPKAAEWLVKTGDGYAAMRQSAENYVRVCNERGLIPKFAEVPGLLEGKPGAYKLKNENYWKLLVDHKMVNQKTGTLIEQRAVTPDFDFEEINRQIDREISEFDGGQFEAASKYVQDRIDKGDLPPLVRELKKKKSVGKLLSQLSDKPADSMPSEPQFSRGSANDDSLLVAGRARVADDAAMGELTPGALASSRELNSQGQTPLTMLGKKRYISLPISEMEHLRKMLTGDTAPAIVTDRIKGGSASAHTRAGKLAIAADVFGLVDKTDMAAEKAKLKQHGFFRNEDATWAMAQTPAAVRAEKDRSENQLADQLLRLGRLRTEGTRDGGQTAARGVFADELAQIVMGMKGPSQGGTLGRIRTIGEGLQKAVKDRLRAAGSPDAEKAMKDEAVQLLDWADGTTGNRANAGAGDLTAEMFGKFLVMPQEMSTRAPTWYAAIVDTIAGDARLDKAWKDLTMRAVHEQSSGFVMQDIIRSQSRATEEALAKLHGDATEPIRPGRRTTAVKESIITTLDDRLGVIGVRVNEKVKDWVAARKATLKGIKDPAVRAMVEAQIDAYTDNITRLMHEMELSRTAFERGGWNEGRRYYLKMLQLENEAGERWGLSEVDRSTYLTLKRIVETQGRAGSFGISARQASVQLGDMANRIGPAAWAKMEEYGRKFHAIIEQEILNDSRFEQAFGKGFADYCRTQADYVTTKRVFSPEELDAIDLAREQARRAGVNGGDDVVSQMYAYAGAHGGAAEALGEGAWTARLKGSMAASQEARSATWEKHDRLMQFVRRNSWVISIRDTLLQAGVEGVSDHKRNNVSFPENHRYGHINYIERGQKRTLVVPRQIADAMKADIDNFRWLTEVNGFARKLFIDWNIAYWNRNVSRNVGSIEKNVPGMHEPWSKTVLRSVFPGVGSLSDNIMHHVLRHLDERGAASKVLRGIFGKNTPLWYVPEATRIAKLITDPTSWQRRLWAAEDAGDVHAVADMQRDLATAMDVLRGNMFVTLRQGVTTGKTEGFANDLMAQKGWKTLEKIREDAAKKPTWKKVLSAVNIFGKNADQQNYEDVLAKTIGYLHDRAKHALQRSPQESGLMVKQAVGIAEGERGGLGKGFIHKALNPFWNMIEKGVTRHWKAVRDRPGETLAKDAAVWFGTVTSGLIAKGVISSFIRWLNGNDEQKIEASGMKPVLEFCDFVANAQKNRSDYSKSNYNATPIWTSADGFTSIFVGLPYNDEDRLVVPTANFATDLIAEKVAHGRSASLTDAVYGQTIGAVAPDFQSDSPALKIVKDTLYAMLVDNPTDTYRGGKVYDQDLYDVKNESLEMRGKFAWAMGCQLWNDLGGRMLVEPPRNGEQDQQSSAPGWLTTVYRSVPVASPLLKSFVKIEVGDIGKDARVINDAWEREQKLVRLLSKDLVQRSLKAGRAWDTVDQQAYVDKLAEWRKTYGLSDYAMQRIEAAYLNGWNAYENGDREQFKKFGETLRKAARMDMDDADVILERGQW